MQNKPRRNQLRNLVSERWQRTLYIMFFVQFMSAVGFSSIFPFLPLYVESLGSNSNLSIELLAGLVFSSQAITMMIASPVWGALADRVGRKLMVGRASFGGAFMLFLMAFARTAEELVLLRAIQGLITGTLAASNALVAAEAPRERTGYAMGLLQVGLGAGVAIGPLIGGTVADAFGYSTAFFVTAALLFLAGITVFVGVDEDFVPTSTLTGGARPFMASWRLILSAHGVRPTYLMRFMSQLGRTMLIPIAPLFIQTLQRTSLGINTLTGLMVGVSSALTTLSAVYLGRLGDRIGHRKIVIASLIFVALLYLPQSLVSNPWELIALRALSGAAMGGVIPSLSSLLARFTQYGEEGAVYGLDNSIRAGARSIAPLIGSSVAVWFGLRASFIAAGLLFAIAALLAARFLPRVEPAASSKSIG
jgi:DHA1 family multidrug resistance protein-like MFS transporter